MALLPKDYKRVSSAAADLIAECNITLPPIDVEAIAKKLQLKVLGFQLGDSASGVLVVENNIGTIGYNPDDPLVRQRFTIAHEIGHFVLHKKIDKESVFVDKDFLVKYRNSKNYSPSEFKDEQEANTFAAELLMPQKLLNQELSKDEYSNLSENQLIEKLAQIFNVSTIAMTYRLTNLNLDQVIK